MYERYVTSPDGVRWVVGRRWLFGRPRYRGYAFGRRREPYFEPASDATPTPAPEAHRVRRSRPADEADRRRDRRAVYRDLDDGPWLSGAGYRRQQRATMRRSAAASSVGGGGGSSAGGSGGRARSASGGRGRSSSGGSGRGGGGAAAAGGGVAAAGSVAATAFKWIVIIAVVAAITAFTIFVALPFILFLLQLALVGLLILWREATGRPYIVEAREGRPAPTVRAWKVVGLRRSRDAIDQVADAIRIGAEPLPTGAETVVVTAR